jgi:SAM-dependent methyltransferase
MAQARPYYADKGLSGAYYDMVTGADDRLAGDIEVYAGLAPTGGSVLELGAGTGRVAFALAERGLKVVGVDLAPAMLAQAMARRAALPAEVAARVELRRGDMTALDLKRTFDLVVCPYFTLAHVPTGAAWRNTFATAARHLEPGGRAAFHLPRLEIMRLPMPAAPQLPVLDLPLPDLGRDPRDDGRRLRLYVRERAFREAVGRLDQVIEYVLLDARGQAQQRSHERLTYYMTDPAPLAATAGLAPAGPPLDIGGVGDIHVFVKTG